MTNPYTLNIWKYSTHSLIAKYIGKNKKVLDVWCNTGYLWTISDISNTFYGVEFLEEAVVQAKKIYKDVLQYDLEALKNLPWNEKFDTIVFADVLEHIRNPDGVLKFFSSFLADNGEIIISLPNVANWMIRLKLLFGYFNYTETGILDKTHVKLYTYDSARTLVQNNGLEIVKAYWGASFFWPILVLLPFLKGLLATNIILVTKRKWESI